MKKIVILNVIISIAAFGFIFYSNAGVSGRDMAIIAFTVIFAIIQAIGAALYCRLAKTGNLSATLLSIVIMLFLELAVFAQWGYPINEWIKSIK